MGEVVGAAMKRFKKTFSKSMKVEDGPYGMGENIHSVSDVIVKIPGLQVQRLIHLHMRTDIPYTYSHSAPFSFFLPLSPLLLPKGLYI